MGRALLAERTKVKALSDELENPLNVHRCVCVGAVCVCGGVWWRRGGGKVGRGDVDRHRRWEGGVARV